MTARNDATDKEHTERQTDRSGIEQIREALRIGEESGEAEVFDSVEFKAEMWAKYVLPKGG